MDYLKERIWNKIYIGLMHLTNGIFVHQSTNLYWENSEMIYTEKEHSLSIPMVVRSLDIDKDPFQPHENDKGLLGPKVPYFSVIGALLYHAKNTQIDIPFSINLLMRFSSYCPTKGHWNGVKHVL